jgi:hypothetical protein
MTTHNTHERQTSIPPASFEPAVPAIERPPTYDLDREATGTGYCPVNSVAHGEVEIFRAEQLKKSACMKMTALRVVLSKLRKYWPFDTA